MTATRIGVTKAQQEAFAKARRDHEAAHAEWVRDMETFKGYSMLKKAYLMSAGRKPQEPKWSPAQPGTYDVRHVIYFDRDEWVDLPKGQRGPWINYRVTEVTMNDYSPQWKM